MSLSSDFISCVASMSDEYITCGGFVTCELCTAEELLEKKKRLFRQMNKRYGLRDFDARWVIRDCTTCQEYWGSEYSLHASIEKVSRVPYNSDSLIYDSWVNERE